MVLALVGGIGAAVERSYARDQDRADSRIALLEAENKTLYERTAELVERVEHVRALAHANRDRIEAAFLELDTKIQREFALADDTLRAELVNLDSRLQGEITTSAQTRLAQIGEIHSRLEVLEAALLDAWTQADQAAFEVQAGFSLERQP